MGDPLSVQLPTRRSGPRPTPAPLITPARLVLLSLSVVTVYCILTWYLLEQPTPAALSVGRITRSVAAACFVASGVLQCIAWRRTLESYILWNALALLVIGLGLPVVATMVVLGPPTSPMPEAAVTIRLALVLGALLLAAVALASKSPSGGRWPTGAGRWMLVSTGSVAAGLLLGRICLPGSSALNILTIAEWFTTMLWVALTAISLRSGRARRPEAGHWGSLGLGAMAAIELAHAIDLTGYVRLLRYSPGFHLLAALMALCAAVERLWTLWSTTDVVNRDLVASLNSAQQELKETERRESERLHDARTAIVSLMGASELLAQRDSLLGQDPARLSMMMSSELRRLSGLLETRTDPSSANFPLSDTLQPLVFAQRMAGADVRLDVDDSWAVGHQDATTSAVANLLTNASVHAPGATVYVSGFRDGGSVAIRVSDNGPGIPPAERRQVLERGARGSTAHGKGSGLGLFTAARTMAAHHGSLEITESPGGGTSVLLTLPACDSPGTATSLAAGRSVGGQRIVLPVASMAPYG